MFHTFLWLILQKKMEDEGMIQGVDKLTTPSYLVVALAVNGNKKTKYVVRWALDKFVPEGILLFKLILVRPKITRIPTPSKFHFQKPFSSHIISKKKKNP